MSEAGALSPSTTAPLSSNPQEPLPLGIEVNTTGLADMTPTSRSSEKKLSSSVDDVVSLPSTSSDEGFEEGAQAFDSAPELNSDSVPKQACASPFSVTKEDDELKGSSVKSPNLRVDTETTAAVEFAPSHLETAISSNQPILQQAPETSTENLKTPVTAYQSPIDVDWVAQDTASSVDRQREVLAEAFQPRSEHSNPTSVPMSREEPTVKVDLVSDCLTSAVMSDCLDASLNLSPTSVQDGNDSQETKQTEVQSNLLPDQGQSPAEAELAATAKIVNITLKTEENKDEDATDLNVGKDSQAFTAPRRILHPAPVGVTTSSESESEFDLPSFPKPANYHWSRSQVHASPQLHPSLSYRFGSHDPTVTSKPSIPAIRTQAKSAARTIVSSSSAFEPVIPQGLDAMPVHAKVTSSSMLGEPRLPDLIKAVKDRLGRDESFWYIMKGIMVEYEEERRAKASRLLEEASKLKTDPVQTSAAEPSASDEPASSREKGTNWTRLDQRRQILPYGERKTQQRGTAWLTHTDTEDEPIRAPFMSEKDTSELYIVSASSLRIERSGTDAAPTSRTVIDHPPPIIETDLRIPELTSELEYLSFRRVTEPYAKPVKITATARGGRADATKAHLPRHPDIPAETSLRTRGRGHKGRSGRNRGHGHVEAARPQQMPGFTAASAADWDSMKVSYLQRKDFRPSPDPYFDRAHDLGGSGRRRRQQQQQQYPFQISSSSQGQGRAGLNSMNGQTYSQFPRIRSGVGVQFI